MSDFVWPSDRARAESNELNRVCEYLEEILDRLEAAERDRDEWARAHATQMKEAQTLVNERDALAAHVERLNTVIFQALTAIDDGDIEAVPFDLARDVYNDAPETSASRLIAEKQAEVLGKCADYGDRVGVDYWQGFLRAKAAELRRQAEELKP